MLIKEKFGKLVLNLDFNGDIDKALIQRCVDKGLFDGNFLQKSIDMEMVTLGRRIMTRAEVNKT